MKYFLFIFVITAFVSCSNSSTESVKKCNTSEECGDNYYCSTNICFKSTCIAENKDSNGNLCSDIEKCNIYITGHTTGKIGNDQFINDIDYFLVKYDKSGNLLYKHQFGTSGNDNGNAITVTSDGFVYIAGNTTGTFEDNINKGDSDIFLSKFDNNGNEIWTKQEGTLGGDAAYKVVADNTSVYITGYVNGTLNPNIHLGESDAFLIKYDSDGNKQWSKQFGTSLSDGGNAVSISNDGYIYVTGSVIGSFNGNDYFGGKDIFLSKFDSSGNILLEKQWGTIADEESTDMIIDVDNNIYIPWKTSGSLFENINSGTNDAFLIKWKE